MKRLTSRDAFTTLREEVPTTGFALYREGKATAFPCGA